MSFLHGTFLFGKVTFVVCAFETTDDDETIFTEELEVSGRLDKVDLMTGLVVARALAGFAELFCETDLLGTLTLDVETDFVLSTLLMVEFDFGTTRVFEGIEFEFFCTADCFKITAPGRV
jgi:hypothetical protein